MKTFLTILLFSISTSAVCSQSIRMEQTITFEGDQDVALVETKKTNPDIPTTSQITSSSENGGLTADKNELNSILSYSVLIFFSVLIIILIDNRNLEKRYKKLLSETKPKDS